MKIKTIKIHNYRAFYPQKDINQNPKPYEIEVNGKNVLIYGENGSGKTSLFRAVRDFIKSSQSSLPFESNAFVPSLNGVIEEGEISLEFIGNTQVFKFTSDSGRNNASTNSAIRSADKASGWLTYAEILKTYLVDKQKPDLFDLLVKQILTNHFLPPSTSKTIGEEWTLLESNINGRRNNPAVKLLLNANGELNCDDFNNGFSLLLKGWQQGANYIEGIESILNNWLSTYFRNGLQVSFNFQGVREETNTGKSREKYELRRSLTLDISLRGIQIPKAEYQNFLNEARLSALAICIFLAAYKTYPTANIPTKVLYLDDVFIGLDMSNRLPLFDILKKEFITQGYQVFISTYDKSWFELAKRHLIGWMAIEMFVGDNDYPVIIPSNSNLQKAEAYFKAKDYPAAGNYLRKELESLIITRLPPNFRFDKNGSIIMELERLIDQLFKYYTDCDCLDLISNEIKEWLKLFKDIVLNPSSHYDLVNPLYRGEVEKALYIVEKLSSVPVVTKRLILPKGSEIKYTDSNRAYVATYILEEDCFCIQFDSSKKLTDVKHIIKEYVQNGQSKTSQANKGIKLSERPSKIEYFFNQSALNIDWRTNFTDMQGRPLIEL